MHAQQLFNLADKVAIVTGSSRGIGKEIAIALGESGAKVVITARRDEWLKPAYEELEDLGIECLAIKTDIAKLEEVQSMIAETLQKWGRIDILVNNAGISWGAPPDRMPLDKWDIVLNTNAKGTLICSQEVGKEMIKQGSGNIINVASTTGILATNPKAMQAIGYQASKAAIIIMTRQLAVEWAQYNIRVNAIAPFFFRTRLSKDVIQRAEGELTKDIPMGRLGEEGELKGVALFLASEASSYITGQVINVDGGMSAW